MKPRLFLPAIAAFIMLLPISAFGDAQIHEWTGTYAMNHDGWVGTLTIADSKKDCATSPWCNLVLSYVDSKGVKRSGTIANISDKWQHMTFYINFPGNNQKFDGYLFSWDKGKMAGTTYWGGRTFGFYAIKK